MKNRFTFLMAFSLMTICTYGQVIDVVTGLTTPVGLSIAGNKIYIAEASLDKISVFEISNPSNISTVYSGSDIDEPFGILVNATDLYVNSGTLNKTVKIDLSSPNPMAVDLISSIPLPEGFAINGNDLYVSYTGGTGGIKKIKLDNPSNIVDVLTGITVGGMVVKNNYLYFSNFIFPSGGDKIQKINLEDANPTPETIISGLGNPNGLTLNGNFLYASEYSVGKIVKIDLSMANPVAEVIASGLGRPSVTAFDGMDMYFSQESLNKVSKIEISQPSFSTQPLVCTNNTPNDLGGASPTGGTYSGPGVTDNGDGETFTFNPAVAGGPGTYTITYTAINGSMVTSMLTVAAAPVVTVPDDDTAPLYLEGTLFDGIPSGGVYSGPGVLPGNVFNAYLAGVGSHTITYTVTDANGCSGSDSGIINVIPDADDVCGGATPINNLLGGALNVPQVSREFNNTGYNAVGDPTTGIDCFVDPPAPSLEHTVWYTFTGDGSTYRIRSVNCNNATPYLDDTQVAIYAGACGNLAAVACNDDEDVASNVFNFSIDVATQAGTPYRMLVDGYNSREGRFCLEVTKTGVSSVIDISQTNIQVFPNPTEGDIQLRNVTAERVEVLDYLGRLVLSDLNPGSNMDISQVADGIYFLKIYEGNHVYTTKVVKQ